MLPQRRLASVPKLWTETVDEHRRAVREAILETTAGLVDSQGLRSVTMSQIAERVGIGRATLYKYFPDVEAILVEWHRERIAGHLEELTRIRERPGSALERLEAVLETYALRSRGSRQHHDGELVAFLHRDHEVGRAQRRVRDVVRDLIVEGAEAGDVRADVPADELASYCLHAVTAAGTVRSKAALARLVAVILDALRRAG